MITDKHILKSASIQTNNDEQTPNTKSEDNTNENDDLKTS